MRPRPTERLLALLSPLLLLLLWEVAARAGWLNRQFFPAPSTIVGTFRLLWERGTVTDALGATARRVLFGYAWGAVPGVALGLVLGLSRPLRVLLLPLANILYSLPKIAVLPLVLLVLGIGEASKIVVTAVSVFFLVLLNTIAGVQGIDRLHFDVARDFGASRWQAYRTVALPGALPLILAGAKLGLGFALIVVVGTEFVAAGAQSGVGVLIWESWQVLNIEAMYVGLILTAALGWALNVALEELETDLAAVARGPRGGPAPRTARVAGVPLRVWWRAMSSLLLHRHDHPGDARRGAGTRHGRERPGPPRPLRHDPRRGAGRPRRGQHDQRLLRRSERPRQRRIDRPQQDDPGGADHPAADALGRPGRVRHRRGSSASRWSPCAAPRSSGSASICLPLAFFYTGWPLKLAYHGLGETPRRHLHGAGDDPRRVLRPGRTLRPRPRADLPAGRACWSPRSCTPTTCATSSRIARAAR